MCRKRRTFRGHPERVDAAFVDGDRHFAFLALGNAGISAREYQVMRGHARGDVHAEAREPSTPASIADVIDSLDAGVIVRELVAQLAGAGVDTSGVGDEASCFPSLSDPRIADEPDRRIDERKADATCTWTISPSRKVADQDHREADGEGHPSELFDGRRGAGGCPFSAAAARVGVRSQCGRRAGCV